MFVNNFLNLICFSYLINDVFSVNVQMRNIRYYDIYDIGQIFIDVNKSNLFSKLDFQLFFSPDYKPLCKLAGYIQEGAEAFACKTNKGFICKEKKSD